MAVLNKKHGNIPVDAVYIGRGSKWGNPFVIGRDGNRDEVCEKHRQYLWQQIQVGDIRLTDLAKLHGKDLVCFCAPQRCHGHTLERAAAWAYSEMFTTSDRGYTYSEVGNMQFRVVSRVGTDFLEHFREHLERSGMLVVSIHDAGNGVYEIDADTID